MSKSIIDTALQKRPVIIAGPCSAESHEQVMRTAEGLSGLGVHCFRAGLWKPRTRPGAFEGVGDVGLDWLVEVRDRFGMQVCTEVATTDHIEKCLKHKIDVVWIGARTTTSPFVVQELADGLRGVDIPVLVKNPVNPDLKLWLGALERLSRAGVKNVGAVHRGFSAYEETDYRNRPRWQIPIDLMFERPDVPMFCDPSHIGGSREFINVIAQKAMDLSFHGLMIETHIRPDLALTDAAQQIDPDHLRTLLRQLVIRSDISITNGAALDKLRREINDLDDELLKVLARRMRVSKEIGEYKMANNMTILQSKRWEELLSTHRQFAEKLGVNPAFVTKLFKLVHQESIDVQERVFGED